MFNDEQGNDFIAAPEPRRSSEQHLKQAERLIDMIVQCSEFSKKYATKNEPPSLYLLDSMFSDFTFQLEGFVRKAKPGPVESLSMIVRHSQLEQSIEEYTGTGAKPNPALEETRANSFGCVVSLLIEALPATADDSGSMPLVRHFSMLRLLWEAFAEQLKRKVQTADHLIGFPMPFEFVSVLCPAYHLPEGVKVLNAEGKAVAAEDFMPDGKKPLSSRLSYCSLEKLGPNLEYLAEIVHARAGNFRLSTALKIYDQLLCRLYVMHSYGIVHTDLRPSRLSFGWQEVSNVLYINNFQSAVRATAQATCLPNSDARFTARASKAGGACSPLDDLESAFYILLWLIFKKLPWDSASDPAEAKENLWRNPNELRNLAENQFKDAADAGRSHVAVAIVTAIFARLRKCVEECEGKPGHELAAGIANGQNVGLYTEQRKALLCYFRFESLSDSLKDDDLTAEVAELASEDQESVLEAWNLQDWCFTHYVLKGMDGTQPRDTNEVTEEQMV